MSNSKAAETAKVYAAIKKIKPLQSTALAKMKPFQYLADSPAMQRVAKTWGLILSGKRYELQDCKNALPAGGDPWIEVIEVDVVLRSAGFYGMTFPQAL